MAFICVSVGLNRREPLALINFIGITNRLVRYYSDSIMSYAKWAFRCLLFCGDIEMNPGPDMLNFCCWNLNSITA